MKKLTIILFIILVPIIGLSLGKVSWGWEVHRYVNDHAVDYLPAEMSFFMEQRSYLQQHSTDPDADPLPGYYHYMDIDYYQEFFDGTLPHNMDNLIALYSSSIVQGNGIVPWIVEEWTDSLSTLMAGGKWDDAWQIAAELGHYAADSHQPLHLTLNYNGQLTGNNGIHSRHETQMINPYLSQLSLPTGTGIYWPNVIDSVFLYIEEIYPYVDSIIIADDLAYAQDPNYGATYYNIMWQELENLTTISIHKAILNLASLWRTAWENAGSPSPLGIDENNQIPNQHFLAEAYPNPFNPTTRINYALSHSGFVTLTIYDLSGSTVQTLVSGFQKTGSYSVNFNASGLSSGVYFYKLKVGNYFVDTRKMMLLR